MLQKGNKRSSCCFDAEKLNELQIKKKMQDQSGHIKFILFFTIGEKSVIFYEQVYMSTIKFFFSDKTSFFFVRAFFFNHFKN